jgi:alkaline phosphatase D
MRLAAAAAVLALLCAGAAGASATEPGFRFGVAAGEVTATSAILWTRAPAAGPVQLELAGGGRLSRHDVRASPGNDLTVQAHVRGLRPAARYTYRFRQAGSASPTGRLVTAPSAREDARVRFSLTGDADATPAAGGRPAWSFDVYARMAAERNDFNVNLGDTIYSDSGVGGAPFARTAAEKWEKYRQALSQPELRALRRSAALYSHWGDHEFVNDFSRPEHGDELYRAGVRSFRDYSPVAYSAATGLYRSRRWGRNLELFFLDGRSFRSAKASAACAGDPAPNLPRALRDRFAPFVPALRDPVEAACRAALRDPSRTMLGARQRTAFLRSIARSTATWKIVITDVPLQELYLRPYDGWVGYAAERERLLEALAKVENVVFLATDVHATLVNRLAGTRIWEVVTGPAATGTFSASLDGLLGVPGAAALVASTLFEPKPPNGLGVRCAALDTRSHAQVTVTSATLTIAARDAGGRLVRDAGGRPCAPLVLRAR